VKLRIEPQCCLLADEGESMVADYNFEADVQLDVSPEYLAAAQSKLSVDQRILLARKHGARMPAPTLTESDLLVFLRILEIIALDSELRVRQALAETLAENPAAPRDVVLKLTQDDDLVATSLLRLSEILTPDDLIKIIEAQASGAKMEAIASRRVVPPDVCLALIDKGDEDTASRLLGNPGADIPEIGFSRIVDRYGMQERIHHGLIDRSVLPATIMERIIALISSDILTRMVERHKIPVGLAAKITLEARSHATLGLTSGLTPEAMRGLIEQLIGEERLTPSLLLRSICTGNIDFVVQVVAVKAHLATEYVRKRLTEGTTDDAQDLWKAADLPHKLLPVIRAAVDVLNGTELDGGKWSIPYYRQRIVERMVTRCGELDTPFSDDDIAFFVAVSKRGPAEANDFGTALEARPGAQESTSG